ncbi:MAG TPA: triosephosphate isomerase, partial [Bryobacterales bacterium]|nr:triosephosphate isomerase [Bryobacterales bacterium]
LEEREAGRTTDVIRRQMEAGCAGVDASDADRLVIAYEPVWAIGTGRTATPELAQAVHADLRSWLADRYNTAIADGIRLLYGGSVKPDNAAALLAEPDIDGALVGGASLKADAFGGIVAAGREAG